MRESPSESSTRGGSLKYALLIACLVLVIILMVVSMLVLGRQGQLGGAQGRLLIEQGLLSRAVVLQADEASRGNEQAFVELEKTRDRFDDLIKMQRAGGGGGLAALPSTLLPAVEAVDQQWQPVRANVETILQKRGAVLGIKNLVLLLEGLMPQLINTTASIADKLARSGASATQVYRAANQSLLAQRVDYYLSQLLSDGVSAAEDLDAFDRDVKTFAGVLQGMASGNSRLGVERVTDSAIMGEVSELRQLFQSIQEQAAQILTQAPELFQAQKAAASIAEQSPALIQASATLGERYGAGAVGGPKILGLPIDQKVGYGLGALALILLALSVLQTNRDTKMRLWESELRKRETEDQNRRNQDAILRLLDELGDLAEGDLTVQATVTEDITGAIADSVNYAIEALRDLVSTINYTSELMASAAQETRSVADRLARASEVQARQIESVSSTVMQMANSMSEVSGKTASSSEEADKSVAIAHEGGERVRRTIQGMDVIREHIQETSKRIKRLGESSQEIGDIVALINDISDQTNILALNAAIQASSAGEAGRGFGVVADEVQRLAERSGNATKRIETLVKTIQADTNEAIISMEKSTTEVVNGADLAEKAGEALEKIESVSSRLAVLINDVSKAASQVTDMTARVSTAMTSINEITAQTSESSVATASSIGKLNQLAQELQQSVAGFRLPEQAATGDA
ncbi:MAG: methyl-accepting chemotaxis protein [Gammaproteobacteria bacterium]|nr:methyl-accepting chemotaxis protein [Gammaproteobacteria bacterium]MCP5458053.1 methyl-accepting chemotaxis protein [Gammaproteobacteria bacterium]